MGRALLPLALAFLLPGGLAAQPLRIEFLSPGTGPAEASVSVGGWPLTLRLSVPTDEVCLASKGPPFTGAGETGFLVLRAGASCESLEEQLERLEGLPPDRTVEFTPDADIAGAPDTAGDRARWQALTKVFEEGPQAWFFSSMDGVSLRLPIGPPTGGDALDGYGYGADDDLPGLVLLADRGMGVMLDADLAPLAWPQARNLAGFLNAVSFEPAATGDRSAIVAHMVVPPRLLSPLLLVDRCVGRPEGKVDNCEGGIEHRADTGRLTPGLPTPMEIAAPVTLRAFLVAGTAPAFLEDEDMNGVVDARDAEIAGYPLLAPEATLVVRTALTPETEEVAFTPADLDRNHDGDDFLLHLSRKRLSLTKVPR